MAVSDRDVEFVRRAFGLVYGMRNGRISSVALHLGHEGAMSSATNAE